MLIAAAAVTTSFFGGAVMSDGHLGAAAWVAIVAFVVLGGCVLVVLWPRHDWAFTIDAEEYIATYVEPSDTEPSALPAIHRDLAIHMADSLRGNRRQVRWLRAFRLAAVLLIVEVLAWVVALIVQGS